MVDRITPKTDDFYVTLIQHIDEKNFDVALDVLRNIENERRQLGALSRVALDLEIDQALDLDLSLNLFLDLTRARDIARAVARELARSIARDLETAQHLIELLLKILIRCSTYPGNEKLAGELTRVQNRADFLTYSLASLFETHILTETLSKVDGSSAEKANEIVLSGMQTLTHDRLSSVVLPFIGAIINLQSIINQVQGIPPTELALQTLTSTGFLFQAKQVPEAVILIHKIVNTWMMEEEGLDHHHTSAEGQSASNAAQNHHLNGITSNKNGDDASSQTGNVNADDLKLVKLSDKLLEQISSGIPQDERVFYIAKLMPVLEIIVKSDLRITSY